MIDKFVYVILILISMVLEIEMFLAGNEFRKMDEKFAAFVFYAMAVLSSVGFGYVFIKGLLR